MGRLLARPAPIVFVLCLLLGLAAVAWRTQVRTDNARAAARTEALARGAAVERQFDQALTAAEVLAALARQGNGAIADFQKVATGLLATHSGVASLELQPGGVVSEVAPRAGHEQAIGRNVLTDPAQGPGARAAIQSRSPTVSGPLALDEGMLGIVARVPVFLKGRDGRESFWGFAAASIRLPEALSRARVDELVGRGYHYAFFAPASAQQRAVGIMASARGAALRETVQQPVRIQNVEFRLALQPRAGWVNKAKAGLESLGVLLASGLICLLVNLLESRHAVEAALADANERLARESADRKQAQSDCLSAKAQAAAALADLKPARAAQHLAESAVTNLQARLEAADRSVQEAGQTVQARQAELEQALATIAELRARAEPVDPPSPPASAKAEPDVPTAAPAPALDPPAQEKPPKPARRKKARGGNQMDLFAASAPLEAQAPPPEELPVPVAVEESESGGTPPQQVEAEPTAKAADVLPVEVAPPEEPVAAAPSEEGPIPLEAEDEAEPAVVTAGIPPVEEDGAPEEPKAALKPPKDKPAPVRRLPAQPPVNAAQLRKAVNLIVPLLTDSDPGAKDCLKDNRGSFRSAFTPEGYVEFEQLIKEAEYAAALELMQKAVKKHGISV